MFARVSVRERQRHCGCVTARSPKKSRDLPESLTHGRSAQYAIAHAKRAGRRSARLAWWPDSLHVLLRGAAAGLGLDSGVFQHLRQHDV